MQPKTTRPDDSEFSLTSHLLSQPVDESCERGKAIKGLAHLSFTVAKARGSAETYEHSIRQESRNSNHQAFIMLLAILSAKLTAEL